MFTDAASERAIIAGIYQYGKDAFFEVSEFVNSTSFMIDQNRAIYTCFAHVLEKDIDAKMDMHLILAAANELKIQSQIEGDAYLAKVVNLKVELSTVRNCAKTIKRLQIARDLYDTTKLIQDDLKKIKGSEPVSSILAIAENKILDFSNNISGNNEDAITLIGDEIEEFVQFLEDNPNPMMGVSTGYPIFDKAIGRGIRKRTLAIIGARPGIGKTLIGDNVAIHNTMRIMQPMPVLVLDTEMDKKGHWPRMLANLSGVTIDDIETGVFKKKQSVTDKVRLAAKKIKNLPFSYINIAGREFDEILSIMRRWIMKDVGYNENGETNDCLIIYDYLKLMDSGGIGDLSEHQLLGFQATSLTNFAQKYNVPILSFIQLNRDGIHKSTSDVIAQSDRILWFASSLSIFQAKTSEEIDEDGFENGNRKMHVLKSRFGGGLEEGNYINMLCKGELGQIHELKTKAMVKSEQRQNAKAEDVEVDEPF